ncbi:small integral membrane protein 13 [Anopheles nili]|uniref:small integral membrane protein 13 n=1 Tax=Anopheles nili TaxID=185578 RepID=UPI00237B88A8|nr:small integral membrane protein 13 [Anopheles nili]
MLYAAGSRKKNIRKNSGGWYLVWKLFLSRFKLVRELLGIAQSNEHSPAHPTLGKDYSTVSSGAGGSINTDGKARTRKVRRD